MHGEGSFAEGRINNLDYGFRETAPTVSVLGRDCGEQPKANDGLIEVRAALSKQ